MDTCSPGYMKGDIRDTFQREISVSALGMDSPVVFAYISGYIVISSM